LSDIPRNNQLGERLWTALTNGIVNDKQLEQRYRAFGKGSFPDVPERPLGDEFDAWLAPRVRAALEGYRRLPPPSQA
jgi:hypothetical protein